MTTRIGLVGISLGGLDAAIFRGINRFARPQHRWHIVTGNAHDDSFAAMLAQDLRGVIGHINTPAVARRLRDRDIPTVNLSGVFPEAGFPLVRPDDRAVGALAARYLAERGFHHRAYLAGNDYYQREREAGFGAAHSFRVEVGADRLSPAGNASFDERQRSEWLRSLPKPVGILTAHDRLALQLLDLCHSLGFDVPGAVAIVGVDNEELVCESSWPTLSSVALPGEQIGMEAARLLAGLMAG